MRRTTTRACKGCGEKFAARLDQVRLGRGKYCSITCTARAGGLAYQAKYPADIDRLFRNRAKETVRRAIARGRMIRGDCESCGTGERVHGHHDDYTAPLAVRWLCVSCHAAHHASERTESIR